MPEGEIQQAILLGEVSAKSGDEFPYAQDEHILVFGRPVGHGLHRACESVELPHENGVLRLEAAVNLDQFGRQRSHVRVTILVAGAVNAKLRVEPSKVFAQRFGVLLAERLILPFIQPRLKLIQRGGDGISRVSSEFKGRVGFGRSQWVLPGARVALTHSLWIDRPS